MFRVKNTFHWITEDGKLTTFKSGTIVKVKKTMKMYRYLSKNIGWVSDQCTIWENLIPTREKAPV